MFWFTYDSESLLPDPADPVISLVLVGLADSLYDGEASAKHDLPYGEMTALENILGTHATLWLARRAMLNEVMDVSPDKEAGEVCDAMAVEILSRCWTRPESDVALGKTLLRAALVDGPLDPLSKALPTAAWAGDPFPVIVLTLLVTGMSASLARDRGNSRPGDPLRAALLGDDGFSLGSRHD
jgi:hypothetical protein